MRNNIKDLYFSYFDGREVDFKVRDRYMTLKGMLPFHIGTNCRYPYYIYKKSVGYE